MFLRYGSNPLYPCVLGWSGCGVRLVASWAYITKLRVDQRCTRLVITERVCRSFRCRGRRVTSVFVTRVYTSLA
jgi:hypothetical protein